MRLDYQILLKSPPNLTGWIRPWRLQWWRDHKLKFPDLSNPARNTFYVVATSAANE